VRVCSTNRVEVERWSKGGRWEDVEGSVYNIQAAWRREAHGGER